MAGVTERLDDEGVGSLVRVAMVAGVLFVAVGFLAYGASWLFGSTATEAGARGDQFAGYVGAMANLAAVALFFAALWAQRTDLRLQRREYALQREELSLQRQELKDGRVVQEQQREALERQRDILEKQLRLAEKTALVSQILDVTRLSAAVSSTAHGKVIAGLRPLVDSLLESELLDEPERELLRRAAGRSGDWSAPSP